MIPTMTKQVQLPLGTNPATGSKYKVVIADDSNIERMLLKKFILQEGFEIVGEAADGLNLASFLKNSTHKPDLVLLDYDMPHKNGVEVISEYRQTNSSAKIVMVTAHTKPALVNQLHKLKVNGMIVKPFNKAKIREKLAKILNRSDFLPKMATVESTTELNLSQLKLPSLPSVITKVLLFNTSDVENGVQELEKIISPDRAICSTVIRISNSAYYGRNGKIKTIRDAITLIGVKNVRNIIIIHHFRNQQKHLKGEKFISHLIEMPVMIALIGFDLAPAIGLKHLKEEIFLHALLYRIGMNAFAMNFPERYIDVLNIYEAGIKSIYEIEKSEFNISSIEIGTKIFNIWKIPEHFSQTVIKQKFTKDEIDTVNDIDRVLRMANLLGKKMKHRLINPLDIELLELLFKHYQVGEEIQEIFSEEYYEIVKEHPFFELMVNL